MQRWLLICVAMNERRGSTQMLQVLNLGPERDAPLPAHQYIRRAQAKKDCLTRGLFMKE